MFHTLSVDRALEVLRSGAQGLSDTEAKARLAEHGPNRLQEQKKQSLLLLFAQQFTDLLIVILAAAAIISGILGEWLDAMAIMAILVLNGVIGFVQEYKAEKALEALKKMTAPTARVIRGGAEANINARDLVPGDIVLIGEGDRVPADARLLETVALEVDEAPLTGESVPVPKDAGRVCELQETIHCHVNMLFLGTVITRGRGKALVTATGMHTELGKIAKVVAEEPEVSTPLQRKLNYLGKQLSAAALIIVAVIFFVGLLRGQHAFEMFLVAVSLAVAAIPEGLPAVLTITLSLGVQRMASKHAIIRRLPAVETLGAATVICTDKTGTLTKNEMTVRRVLVNGTFLRVTGEGYSVRGDFIEERTGSTIAALAVPGMKELLEAGVLCNNSSLSVNAENGKGTILGDPTEACLLVVAAKAGLEQGRLLAAHAFTREIPFDSARKMMTVIRTVDNRHRAYVKGAPEVLVAKCTRVLHDSGEKDLTPADRDAVIAATTAMASESLRVLGFAYRDLPDPGIPDAEVEQDLVFIGLAGMMDPPRAEARTAVQACREAGVRVVMITGDNPTTAGAVARELNLDYGGAGGIMTGMELDTATEDDLRGLVEHVGVYARVSPEHKLRIVDALKSRDEIVAMTGDGVNDAPAIKRADIGVAMGITGTEVTKEASDMVITDDNFASIERAVEEGRVIYANILKAVNYLLSCNIGELITIFTAIVAGLASPITPIQILWMNIITDSPPALALAMNPGDPDIMKRPPQDPKGRILTARFGAAMVLVGLLLAIVVLGAYTWYLGGDVGMAAKAGTMAFCIIIMYQQFFALSSSGSGSTPVLATGLFRNRWLWAAFFFGFGTQVLITEWAPAWLIFDTVPLDLRDWGIVMALASTAFIVPELVKWGMRWRGVRAASPAPSA
ncbi:MAG: cation-translocating P-type ATPase [Methanomicrobiales archaeon]|nr:cation-translocating P-type ATPase [Methanomicrobiales archaeon]